MEFYGRDGEDLSGFVMGLDERCNKLENRVDVYRREGYRLHLQTVELQNKVQEQHDEIMRLTRIIDRLEANKKR